MFRTVHVHLHGKGSAKTRDVDHPVGPFILREQVDGWEVRLKGVPVKSNIKSLGAAMVWAEDNKHKVVNGKFTGE